MDELQRNYITKNLSTLVDHTTFNTTCAAVLEEKGVFGRDDLAILAAIPNEREKVRCFYQLVMQKAGSYAHVIAALEQGNQSGAVETLTGLNTEVQFSKKDENSGTSSSITDNQNIIDHNFGQRVFLPIRFEVLDPVRLFTGRVEELEQLHQTLQTSTTKLEVDSQMAFIVGPGGIGKSELARAYIRKYKHEYDNNVIWINSGTEETFEEGFRRLAKDCLKLPNLNADGNIKQLTSVIEETYNVFSETPSLFVLDNAESIEHIHKFLPFREAEKPYFLITSRNIDQNLGAKTLVLLEWDQKEAIKLVKNVLQIEDKIQDESITQLVRRLQYFPLAMSQAVSYIKQRQRLQDFSIDDYLKLFQSCTQLLVNLDQPFYKLNFYTRTTMATLKITTDLLSASGEAGRQAIQMLFVFSNYQPDKIPTALVFSCKPETDFELSGISKFVSFLIRMFKSIKSFQTDNVNEDALGSLVKNSMVSIQLRQKTISIHPLVQDVIRNQLKENQIEETILRKAMKSFSGRITLDCLNHAYSVFKHCAAYKSLVVEFKAVSWNILKTLEAHGTSPSAVNIAAELREIVLKYISPEDVDAIRLEILTVRLEYQLGAFESSLKKLKRILSYYEENKSGLFSEGEIFQIKQLYATILKKLGRRSESLEFLIQSYQKYKRRLGENHYLTIDSLTGIAKCLNELGHFNENPPVNAEYLQILFEDFGMTDPQEIISVLKTAFDKNNYAIRSSYAYANVFYGMTNCIYELGDKYTSSVIAKKFYEVTRHARYTRTQDHLVDSRIQIIAEVCLNTLAKMEKTWEFKALVKKYSSVLTIKNSMLLEEQELSQMETDLETFQKDLKMDLIRLADDPLGAETEFGIAFTLYKMKKYSESLCLLLELKAKIHEKFPQLEELMTKVNIWIEEIRFN